MLNCPCCNNPSFKRLINFGKIPKSGIFLKSLEDNLNFLNLEFEFCNKCALIRRVCHEDVTYDYTNIPRATKNQLPKYTQEILDSFTDKSKFIMEVGSNDGTFLDVLKTNGFNSIMGIEPSISCASIAVSKGHSIENCHLNIRESSRIADSYGKADIVIARHTLEHVPSPREFLDSIKNISSPKGMIYLEFPDSYGIIHKNYGHELWDEHLHYFSVSNFLLLAKNISLETLQIKTKDHLQGKNILVWLRNNESQQNFSHDFSKDVISCYDFEKKWNIYSYNLRERIINLRKPILGIGASHPQSNFFLFTHSGEYLDYLIDDNPSKKGLYLPVPNPVEIISSNSLNNDFSVIRTAFGYESWMDNISSKTTPNRILNTFR